VLRVTGSGRGVVGVTGEGEGHGRVTGEGKGKETNLVRCRWIHRLRQCNDLYTCHSYVHITVSSTHPHRVSTVDPETVRCAR